MADRRVICSGKDIDGEITQLGNAFADWSPRNKVNVINDIESDIHRYFVRTGTTEANVHVVERDGEKYLRTNADSQSSNNLDNLPDC